VHLAVYLPFLASLLLGAAAPSLARRLPPATAARLLAGTAVLAAGATCAAIGFLAATALGRLPVLAEVGHWSAGRLAADTPVPLAVGLAAVAVVVAGALNGLRVLAARGRAVLAVRALGRELPHAGRLVVLDEDIDTVAVPARGGRILASRAHLAELPADERRALLLHESAHLAHRHHLYRLAVDLAGAVDPLQRGVRAAVLFATERWADEEAAGVVGDRAVVARVLARSGLRAAGAPRAAWAALAMGRAGSPLVPRVQALLDPAPRQRPGLVLAAAGLLALVVLGVGSAVHAQEDTESVFEQAMATPPHAVAALQPGTVTAP
jgi:hypothetical protein